MEEPQLATRPPFWRRARFLVWFVPPALVAVALVVLLLITGNAVAPFRPVEVLRGSGGSSVEFLEDPQVRALLLSRNIRLELTRSGSRDSALRDLSGLDLVLPSGQPGTELVTQRRRRAGQNTAVRRLFVSPLVIGAFRPYAEALVRVGVARPQEAGTRPSYYDLDVSRLIDLMRTGRTWDSLGIGSFGLRNGNVVLAQSDGICESNSAATYLALLAFAMRGDVVTTEAEATAVATELRPLLVDQGAPTRSPEELFFGAGGDTIPMVVLYEHQYLAHQLRQIETTGSLDTDRVLLYPTTSLPSETAVVALDPPAAALGDVLAEDAGVRERALELGYRVVGEGDTADGNEPLEGHLQDAGVTVPSRVRRSGGPPTRSETRALLPETGLLEKMISVVGNCR